MESLDFAGICVQARQVGGDYCDFLYLSPGRLGVVLADISGKGISAALLMASLQTSLRSHYVQAPDDLARVLSAINRTFFDSTAGIRYATLFLGTYDERTSRLRHANCGHPPPVLLAADGSIERLQPTGSMIGLFEEWNGTTQEIGLSRRDTLVMFTDGSWRRSTRRTRSLERNGCWISCASTLVSLREDASSPWQNGPTG
jgi:serine phosphatase RsbU (regulator of sigma subunit)